MRNYLFSSQRLGFRNWEDSDIKPLTAICTDPEVMEYFPKVLSLNETLHFIGRMRQSFTENGYCYFAVDLLETVEFIGFIGLSYQNFQSEFTPLVDIGWRLKKTVWNKGYATEGAQRCLEFGFNQLKLKSIYAIAPDLNVKSQRIMTKIGMVYTTSFLHPNIAQEHPLQKCVLYKITNSMN